MSNPTQIDKNIIAFFMWPSAWEGWGPLFFVAPF